MSSSFKTLVLLAAFVAIFAGVFNVKGLKISHGIGIGLGLVVIGNLIPDTAQPAAA